MNVIPFKPKQRTPNRNPEETCERIYEFFAHGYFEEGWKAIDEGLDGLAKEFENVGIAAVRNYGDLVSVAVVLLSYFREPERYARLVSRVSSHLKMLSEYVDACECVTLEDVTSVYAMMANCKERFDALAQRYPDTS